MKKFLRHKYMAALLCALCVLALAFAGVGGFAENDGEGAVFGIAVVTHPTEPPCEYGISTGLWGYGNAEHNVRWVEYELDGVRTLVFRVVDETRPAQERAVTQLLGEDGASLRATLRESTNRVVLEEGVTGAGWTYQYRLNDGVPAWSAATHPVDQNKTDVFNGFSALTEVVPCESLVMIGWSAFRNCEKLSSFDFTKCPNLVEVMNQAFNNCKALNTVDLSACEELTTLGWSAFNGAGRGSNARLALPMNGRLTVIGGHAFEGFGRSTGNMALDIPASVTQILQDAFNGCAGLRSVGFANASALVQMGANAFKGARSLALVSD